MSEIGRVNKHKTTHQDGGDDELVLTGILPGVHKTTHQDTGDDEIDATGLAGRCDFVERPEPADADFVTVNFTTDGNQHDLDLSGIVPVGAKAVLFGMELNINAAGARFRFRKKGVAVWGYTTGITSQVATVQYTGYLIIHLPSTRIIEYKASNLSWSDIAFTVKGWWI